MEGESSSDSVSSGTNNANINSNDENKPIAVIASPVVIIDDYDQINEKQQPATSTENETPKTSPNAITTRPRKEAFLHGSLDSNPSDDKYRSWTKRHTV